MNNPFTLISTKHIYDNPWIAVREDTVIRPWGKEGIFGIVTMQDGVTIIAVDNANNVITTNEFAYAIHSYSLEWVSGGIDHDESPLECAKRELKEETGYEANEWIDLGYIDPFTSIIRARNILFLARDLKLWSMNPDEWEILNVGKIAYKKALEMVMNSEISHWASVVAILKAQKYIIS